MIPSLEGIDWRGFLERPAMPTPPAATLDGLKQERILLTGAGGSIGSRLAMRLAGLMPQHLMLLESSENRLLALQGSLKTETPGIRCILGNAGDRDLLNELFDACRPTLIFHAAAYKHVPLLEQHPFAAIENNIFATESLVATAREYGARIVLLSTDKAVEPASMLGASKRIAELIVLDESGTALRLGNVLASSGSVVETFATQIAAGGPMTVTDPAARRYFITIDEAVNLLLAASAVEGQLLAPSLPSQHFVADLARFLAKELAPNREIAIEFTAPRPGDKELERLWGPHEGCRASAAPGLLAIDSPRASRAELHRNIAQLRKSLEERDLPGAIDRVRGLVPEFTPSTALEALALQGVSRAAP